MQQFLDSLRADGARFAEVVRSAPLDAEVPSCPGWTLADLTRHMAYIHRWVVMAVVTREQPQAGEIAAPPDSTNEGLARWLQDGVGTLVRTLEAQEPDAPTWHPFTAPMVAGVWPRRQAHETMIHRWDAENSAGAITALDPLIAADGILEYFELIVPRVIGRERRVAPQGVLRLECPDVGFVCTVSSGTTVDVELGDGVTAAPDASVRADAQDVMLALWKRVPLPGDQPPLAQEWLRFGGN